MDFVFVAKGGIGKLITLRFLKRWKNYGQDTFAYAKRQKSATSNEVSDTNSIETKNQPSI